MNVIYILMLMTTSVRCQEVPGFPRKTDANQDLGYANQNFSDLASRNRDKATNTIGPQFCPTGQTLTGAYYNKSGATIGGTCTAVGNVSLSGNNNFSSASTVTISGYNNLEVMIASADFSAVTASTIPITSYWGPTSSTTYHVHSFFRSPGGGNFVKLFFNGDANTGNYVANILNFRWASGNDQNGSSPCRINCSGTNTMDANSWCKMDFKFETPWGGPSTSILASDFSGSGNGSSGSNSIQEGGLCIYTGTTSPTSVSMQSSTINSISGHWELWQGQYHQP